MQFLSQAKNAARTLRAQFMWGIVSRPDKRWRTLLTQLYEKRQPSKVLPTPHPQIPKIIHQIWLGSPLPKGLESYTRTWQALHPGWQYILWTEENVRHLNLQNQALFDQATNYAVKSDILRYELLYKFGGLYVDTDFECLMPFDSFVHRYTAFAGISNEHCFAVNNALIAAAPGHEILKKCIENISAPKSYRWQDVSKACGPMHFTKQFMVELGASYKNALALPQRYFYPKPLHGQANSRTMLSAYAVHHWDASWV